MKRFCVIILLLMVFVSVIGGCSFESEQSQNTPDASAEVSPETLLDERGISGMKATAIMLTAQDTFGISYSEKESDTPEYSAYTCVSSGEKDGVIYDYSISLDSDSEIIGATFGTMASTASAKELLSATDLYFYTVSLISYDTADKETLSAWMEESLPNASNDATSITIGDAKFELYGINGASYWVDISKVS